MSKRMSPRRRVGDGSIRSSGKANKKPALAVDAYRTFLSDLKDRVTTSRLAAARSVNRELVRLYWHIGESIVRKQKEHGWGDAVVERLSKDLMRAFPDMRGFSPQNLWRMRQFHLDHTHAAFLKAFAEGPQKLSGKKLSQAVRELVEQIPWGHYANVLHHVETPAERAYYLRATAAFGWSRNVLLHQWKNDAYDRARKARKLHNFHSTLPKHLSDLAEQTLKSSYNIEFIGAKQALSERKLEERLITRVQQFILELGYGFCFIGRQYRLVLVDNEYFIDLLFYHRFLKCLVAIDLKVGSFKPEHSGKMDFYLNVLNDKERSKGDNPSIGIILCGKKDDVVVEYSLRGSSNPIGVADYRMSTSLPRKLHGLLPSAHELQAVVQEELSTGKGRS